ncbi:MAG: putative porin, partial [Saprospiraceae bacterium]
MHIRGYAQRPIPGSLPAIPGQQQVDSSEQEELVDEPPDTVLIYHPYQLKTGSWYNDTTLGEFFQQYDAVRLREIPYLNLGNNGSQHRPGMFVNEKRQGLDIGSHVLDLYKYTYEDLNLYDSRKPLAIFRFSQKNFKQEQLQLETQFSKTFQNGLHLNLMFRSIQYKGDFAQQINKNRCGDFNAWYHAPKGNYDFIFNYLYNDLRQQDNGGIPGIDSILRIPEFRSRPDAINAFLIDGRTRQQEKSFSIQNGFNVDWKGNKVGVTHRISTSNHVNDFMDVTDPSDSAYYGQYYVRDTQQIYIKAQGIVNEIFLDGLLDTTTSLRAGIKHEHYNIYQANS